MGKSCTTGGCGGGKDDPTNIQNQIKAEQPRSKPSQAIMADMKEDTKSSYSKQTGTMSMSSYNTNKSNQISKQQMHHFFEKGFNGIQNEISKGQ